MKTKGNTSKDTPLTTPDDRSLTSSMMPPLPVSSHSHFRSYNTINKKRDLKSMKRGEVNKFMKEEFSQIYDQEYLNKQAQNKQDSLPNVKLDKSGLVTDNLLLKQLKAEHLAN